MKKKITTAFFLATILALTLHACQTHGVAGDPAPIASPGDPVLPITAFDDTGVHASIPAYLKVYLADHPLVDNTPATNPITSDHARAGTFFLRRGCPLIIQISCGSCQHQNIGFADGRVVSKGLAGGITRRNSMPVNNTLYFKKQKIFWDLRAATLEDKVLM